jgi:hypothetical protein
MFIIISEVFSSITVIIIPAMEKTAPNSATEPSNIVAMTFKNVTNPFVFFCVSADII